MPKDFQRSRRIEEQIQRLLVDLVRKEVKDPRVGLVTITAVEVSRDLSHAKVFFLPFDSKRPVEEVRTALASAAGFLLDAQWKMWKLKKLLQIRHVPELRFLPDKTIDEAARLSVLINSAVASDARRAADAQPAPGEATDEVDGVDETDDTDDTDEAGPAP
ncbi:MAG: 30S ribosome-binding factor RbfA [Proteobacteria bacterium]|nr:30S ribosome-binding factor RbfA [Pseudomonadota bacterium]